jgi:hypothetical protein
LQIKIDKRGRVAGYTEIQQNELFAILPTKMNSPKYVYKSIAYSRRGVSLIQAPPEVLHANSYFTVAEYKTLYYCYTPPLPDDFRHESRPPRSSKIFYFILLPLKFPLCVADK